MKEIDVQKWIEGEHRHSDPGQEYILNWIKEHAAEYREEWEAKNGKLEDGIDCDSSSGRFPRLNQ